MPTQAALSRVVLVEEPSRQAGRVRRYRVARINLNPQPGLRQVGKRFDHLKRAYD